MPNRLAENAGVGWLAVPGAFPTSPVLKGAIPGCKHCAHSRSMRNDASRDESSCIATEKEKRDEVSVLATKMFDLKSTIVHCDVANRISDLQRGRTENLLANIGKDAERAILRALDRRALHTQAKGRIPCGKRRREAAFCHRRIVREAGRAPARGPTHIEAVEPCTGRPAGARFAWLAAGADHVRFRGNPRR